ncbi:HK97 gp10 family phage protein [Virgibacillus litoralis]|uniref:HK97 gp10 family phage protein n=2 Tax=Virgibacillus litoralis TaxID=578221 RepID=A0ABS4HH85_9BACI|nr:HK97-gp10 family putative phage morphogenesis protein [Virgibacillus litoralis]MBP1950295.1 HK97 gp10 family phage protein [Virgibacillus litoralis]
MKLDVRNKVSQLGRKGKVLEGQTLKAAGNKLGEEIASNINRSSNSSADYTHLADAIKTSSTRTNEFGERSVQVGASKDKAFILKFLELGTSKMSAQAPMEKGISQSKGDVARILAEGQQRILRL